MHIVGIQRLSRNILVVAHSGHPATQSQYFSDCTHSVPLLAKRTGPKRSWSGNLEIVRLKLLKKESAESG